MTTRGKGRSQDTFRLQEKTPLDTFIGEKGCIVPVETKDTFQCSKLRVPKRKK